MSVFLNVQAIPMATKECSKDLFKDCHIQARGMLGKYNQHFCNMFIVYKWLSLSIHNIL